MAKFGKAQHAERQGQCQGRQGDQQPRHHAIEDSLDHVETVASEGVAGSWPKNRRGRSVSCNRACAGLCWRTRPLTNTTPWSATVSPSRIVLFDHQQRHTGATDIGDSFEEQRCIARRQPGGGLVENEYRWLLHQR